MCGVLRALEAALLPCSVLRLYMRAATGDLLAHGSPDSVRQHTIPLNA